MLQADFCHMQELCSIRELKLNWQQAGAKYPFIMVKQFFRRVIRWFMNPYFLQQEEFNAAAAATIGDMKKIQDYILMMLENEDKQVLVKTNVPRIVQIVQNLHYGDAVGNEVMSLKEALKAKGIVTEIYTFGIFGNIPDGMADNISNLPELRENDIVIYHFAFEDSLAQVIQKLKCIKVLRYHNVTPPEFFEKFNEETMQGARRGLRQIKEMRNEFNYVMADSEFNKNDLLKMGYQCPIYVVPILIRFEDYMKKPSERVINQYSDGVKNILFVGRISPNKKIEDVISVYDYYHKNMDSNTRLIIVGAFNEKDKYYAYLQKQIKMLQAKNVIFTGHIMFDEILGYYHVADAFLCMSEHEGFCVPLVEAMYFNVPIVAYASTAVPETMDGCGLLLEKKEIAAAAEGLRIILNDKSQIEAVKLREEERIKEFNPETVEEKIIELLQLDSKHI